MKWWIGLGKTALAGITAIVILSVVIRFYRLSPVHVENPKGNTDYVWPANARWVNLTEGISWGSFDERGFHNEKAIDHPNIIMLGSSHMEGCNVMQKENAAYLLGEKMGAEVSVYNMGISGHNFYKICQYLPVNLEQYTPDIAVLETSAVELTESGVNEVLQSTVEFTPSHSRGILAFLQKSPFLRLLYHQVNSGLFDLFMDRQTKGFRNQGETGLESEAFIDQEAYNALFSYLAKQEKEYGTQIVIFYHPQEQMVENGTIEFENTESLAAFTRTAREYGITFVNMAPYFQEMFYKERRVPHGFVNGEIGSGHLNANGHRAVADVLFYEISELEGNGLPCK